jgi:hypothetical protein
VAAAIATICQRARTELAGDGHVFVLPVSTAIRIRTAEAGEGVPRVDPRYAATSLVHSDRLHRPSAE